MKAEGDSRCPLSYGLNSRLEKENGQLVERVWKVGGLYSEAIERIVAELEKAAAFAENEKQRQIIAMLIDYYRTGDLRTFDAYSILWVEDTDSQVDFVNGFIETYGDAFYKGELADKIDAFMQEHNGFLRKSDLEAYKPEWVEPLSVNYRGYDIWELPPNGHGITVLMALNILKGYNFTERDTVETMHKQIEAMKLSFVDTKEYVAEPSYMKVTAEQLLSERYAADRRALINDKALEPVVGDPRYSSTVYFCTADAEGNMVSMIQSNYRGFGSGIVVPGTSISFNDRAENFSFDETHPNALQGGKRPYHTIIPAFMTKDGQAVSAFGIMGGFMQPQAHVQVAMNMIDFGLNPQQALDAPRWQWIGGKTVEVEQDTPNHIIRQLQRMGHNVVVQPDPYHMGRGQIIIRDEDGVLCGATEKRTDGQIACF